MVGSAVATMVWLSAARNMASISPTTMARISAWVGARSAGVSLAAAGLTLAGVAARSARELLWGSRGWAVAGDAVIRRRKEASKGVGTNDSKLFRFFATMAAAARS